MTHPPRILVTGASGHVGGDLVRQLASAGHHVRAMTRKPDDLAVPAGTDVVAGDADEPLSLRRAFSGVDRAFLMSAQPVGATPRPTHVPALVDAARRAGVGHVVLLSVHSGGDGDDAIGDWWGQIERAVLDSGMTSTLLRPGRFMSNALGWAPRIRTSDEITIPFAHQALTSIDPADIAAVAGAALTDTTVRHHDTVYQLSGPVAMTPAEEVAQIATLLGRTLRVVDPPADQIRASMVSAGMPDTLIEAVLTRSRDNAEGSRVLPTVEQILGRPPRTFAAWADAHLDAFAGGRR